MTLEQLITQLQTIQKSEDYFEGAEVRITDDLGQIHDIAQCELDGNGHVYIDANAGTDT